jgi:hypothetical protein
LTRIYKKFRIKTGAEPSEHSCHGMILIIYNSSCRACVSAAGAFSPWNKRGIIFFIHKEIHLFQPGKIQFSMAGMDFLFRAFIREALINS